MVIDAARAGVKAIHCEKPMAPTWGEARQMLAVCEEHGVQLTFNHQRRFGAPFRKAKELLDTGAIGQLLRLEAFTSNLYDWGTHWFDMLFFYNDETPVDWVIGQIDARGARPIFGVMLESQGLSLFQYRNGVQGLMVTGSNDMFKGVRGQMCANRLIGSDGVIEVGVQDGPQVRLRSIETGGRWQDYEVGGRIHGEDMFVAAIADLVEALKTGRGPELAGRRALQATELIFATYESSRRRARVDLPLEIEDSPLLSMLESGEVTAG
jgi:predicted dehydrogenase